MSLMNKMAATVEKRDQTYPLKYVQEVLAWNSLDAGPRATPLKERGNHSYSLKVTDDLEYDLIPASTQPQQRRQEVMVCHDMRGGYLEDKYYHGASGLQEEPYRFVHWSLIDTWIYFSHHFVTIPPFGWIQAAHENGVRVLGTIITEFDDGQDLCNEFLVDDDVMRKFVSNCCAIARDVGFEGWLLNIENKLAPEKLPRLKEFVRLLTQEMRGVNPKSKVIWYDSLTIEGCLDWQNELNGLNFDFFDACDGIFLNYGWKVDDEVNSIKNSLGTLDRFGAVSRNFDIFFGVDVFGRGTYGGGGFDSFKAFQAVANRTSMAIFAPAWTFEQCDPLSTNPSNYFTHREYKFWKLLEPFLTSKPIVLTSGFHSSSLCNGVGYCSQEGGCCWWLNLECQGLMPPHYAFPNVKEIGTEDETDNKLMVQDPFSLIHYQDWNPVDKLPVSCNHAGGLALTRSDTRSWSFFGLEGVVPLLICQMDLDQQQRVVVELTFRLNKEDFGTKTSSASGNETFWPIVYTRCRLASGETKMEQLELLEQSSVMSTEDPKQQQHLWRKGCFESKTASDLSLDCLAVKVPSVINLSTDALIIKNISIVTKRSDNS